MSWHRVGVSVDWHSSPAAKSACVFGVGIPCSEPAKMVKKHLRKRRAPMPTLAPAPKVVCMGCKPAKTPEQGLANTQNDLDFEETWTIISSALREMHTKNASSLSFETIYRHAYKVVLKKKGDVFYERIQEFERTWLGQDVRAGLQLLMSPVLYTLASTSGPNATVNERRAAGEKFMRGLKQTFEDHQLVMNMSTDVFMYLVGTPLSGRV